ncbi:MAG: aspartate aminotransferase family protein [Candidatus Thorarchaeota archaeon]|nr:MAG: aspartate aminotransferase family protein [Candidatus Thorarchaeota archaeon]
MLDRDDIIKKEKEFMVPAYARKEIVVHKGKGTLLWDLDGTEYIDCLSGISVVNAGHSPDRLVKAGSEQLSMLLHCSGLYHNVPQTLLAEKLAGLTPSNLKKSFFCNSGAEAVEGAVKIAKKYCLTQGRSGAAVIALEGSFHGRLALSLTLTGQAKYKQGFGTFANAPGVVHAPMPYCYRCPLAYPDCGIECARRVEDIVKYHTTGDVAAMIVEPILGEGGIVVPPDEYHATVQKICKDHDILYIADEVQTGVGRTGKMFAIELFGISPDIMTMAKGLGAGMPIGGYITTDEIAGSLVSGDHFSTFGGNPVCCRVAAENLDYLQEEGLVKNSAHIGDKMMKQLLELQESLEVIGEVRGKGLMIGIELVKDNGTKEPAEKATQSVANNMVKSGALVGTGGVKKNVLRIQPPLCMTEEQSERVLNLLEAALKGI